MGMGIAGLMRGAGAGEGLQTLLKQRLMERQMALAEQAQREGMDFRNRELTMRGQEVNAARDETRRYRDDVLAQGAEVADATNTYRAANETPYAATVEPAQAIKFKARGYPVVGPSQEDLNSPLANEEIPDYQYAGNKPTPQASKLMTPEEFEQWKRQKETEAQIGAKYRAPSSAGTPDNWTDSGRTDKDGNAILQRTSRDGRLETMVAPYGAKLSPGAEAEATRKRQTVVDATNRTLNAIDELMDEKGTLRPEMSAAIGSSRLTGIQRVPGTNAYNAQAAIDRLRARLVTDLMAELKSQSRTGATGFGQLNLQELKIIQDSAAKLDPGQSEQAFQTELQKIRQRLLLILQDEPGKAGGAAPGDIEIVSITETKK